MKSISSKIREDVSEKPDQEKIKKLEEIKEQLQEKKTFDSKITNIYVEWRKNNKNKYSSSEDFLAFLQSE